VENWPITLLIDMRLSSAQTHTCPLKLNSLKVMILFTLRTNMWIEAYCVNGTIDLMFNYGVRKGMEVMVYVHYIKERLQCN